MSKSIKLLQLRIDKIYIIKYFINIAVVYKNKENMLCAV